MAEYQSVYTGTQIDAAVSRVINGEFDDAVTAAEAAQQAAEQAAQESRAVLKSEEERQAAEAARNVWEVYSDERAYEPGNKVSHGGSSYVNLVACQGVAPPDERYWLAIAAQGAQGVQGERGEQGPVGPEGKIGPSGDGSGDMIAAVYDPQGHREDVFGYVDSLVGDVANVLNVLLYGEEAEPSA
ncbi:MAG: hypothetical protein HFF09_03690 [Oscillospiraceae bacterium]|nr:hypothetical protein [Oscillospiraceae bacterium]